MCRLGFQKRTVGMQVSFNTLFTLTALHRWFVYPLEIVRSHLSLCECYLLKRHWGPVGVGWVKLAAPTLLFQAWRKNFGVRDGWEELSERVKGSLIRTASNSWDRIWHAKSHCGMYDNGDACVLLCSSCMLLSTNVCVFFPSKWGKKIRQHWLHQK